MLRRFALFWMSIILITVVSSPVALAKSEGNHTDDHSRGSTAQFIDTGQAIANSARTTPSSNHNETVGYMPHAIALDGSQLSMFLGDQSVDMDVVAIELLLNHNITGSAINEIGGHRSIFKIQHAANLLNRTMSGRFAGGAANALALTIWKPNMTPSSTMAMFLGGPKTSFIHGPNNQEIYFG